MLSIVVPVYNEESVLPELERRLAPAVADLGFQRLEFLVVSDGSTDQSDRLIRSMVERDPRYRGIFLTRNFGHQSAVNVGLQHARGSIVAILDGDLQDPPEVLGLMIEAIDQGADVAYGVRAARKEGPFKRAAYFTFYRLLRHVSAIDIPLDTGDFCVMRRRVVDAMMALPETNRFLRGLRAWVGYDQVGVTYERSPRFAGQPKFTLRKLVALAYDGLFSFTSLPIRVIQAIGFLLSILAIAIAITYVVWYVLAPEQFPRGFASLIISIWFFAGVQLLCLGIVGEYVVRTCEQGRGRPPAIVREIFEIRPDPDEPDDSREPASA